MQNNVRIKDQSFIVLYIYIYICICLKSGCNPSVRNYNSIDIKIDFVLMKQERKKHQ